MQSEIRDNPCAEIELPPMHPLMSLIYIESSPEEKKIIEELREMFKRSIARSAAIEPEDLRLPGPRTVYVEKTIVLPKPIDFVLADVSLAGHDEGCRHSWRTYVGFTDSFEYCVHCDAKKELTRG